MHLDSWQPPLGMPEDAVDLVSVARLAVGLETQAGDGRHRIVKVLGRDQEVEVIRAAIRGIAVQPVGQEGALQGEHRDATLGELRSEVAREQLDYPRPFGSLARGPLDGGLEPRAAEAGRELKDAVAHHLEQSLLREQLGNENGIALLE
jgi:hypothetical protein